jgi:hypothetical protein
LLGHQLGQRKARVAQVHWAWDPLESLGKLGGKHRFTMVSPSKLVKKHFNHGERCGFLKWCESTAGETLEILTKLWHMGIELIEPWKNVKYGDLSINFIMTHVQYVQCSSFFEQKVHPGSVYSAQFQLVHPFITHGQAEVIIPSNHTFFVWS